MPLQITITSINKEFLTLNWSDGHQSKFHFLWLRDNCRCELCGAHYSGSRFQAFLDIPLNISPEKVSVHNDEVTINWKNQNHTTIFKSDFLRENCYVLRQRRKKEKHDSKIIWDSSLPIYPSVDYQEALVNEDALFELFQSVETFGFVLIKNVGTLMEQTSKLASRLGYVRDTHFGQVGDLIPRKNATHIADFSTTILPHTDETYRSIPIGINIFHCIKPSDDKHGGSSVLVDAFHCAKILKTQHPQAFSLLSTVPIQHERHAKNELIRSNLPVFSFDENGNLTQVRLNERTMSAICVAPEQTQQVYQALRDLFSIAYDKKNQICFRMEAGDALVFDNTRILHARTAFSGHRHIRQTNVMSDEFYAKLEFLTNRINQAS